MSSPNQGATHAPSSQTRLIAIPHDIHAAGRNTFLVQPVTGESARRVDSTRLQLLQSCGTLATAQEHAWAVARMLQHPNPAFLVSLLDELRQHELLIDEDSILQKTCQVSSGQIAPLESLFIRSSGRPLALSHALHSLEPFAHSLKRCVIIDDTRNDCDRAAVDQVVERIRPKLSCALIHFKREQRSALVHKLAQDAAANPEQLHWFVQTPNDRIDGYGCGINLALLLSAGQRFLLLDDDARLQAFERSDTSAAALSMFHMLSGSGLESSDLAAEKVDINPIEAHEQVLGRTPGEIPSPPQTIDRASPDMLLWLKHAGRIRFTSNGVYGDPGTRQPHWLYCQSAKALSPWQDAERYEQALHRRQSIRCESGPRIIINYSTMTTTLTGIDNRELLAPTLPFSVGEDTVLGELVRYTDPGSLLHAAPWMLEHYPETPRHWAREDAAAAMTHNVGTFFKHMLVNDAWTRSSNTSGARMQSLGALMNDIARADRNDLEHELLRQTLECRAGLCQSLEARRPQWSHSQHVAQDIDRMLEANRTEQWQPGDDPEADLNSIHKLAEGYATGLNDWIAAWQAARERSVEELLG